VGGVYTTTKEVDSVGEIANIALRQADDDMGPFTCQKIDITAGASEWSFECNSILDKNNKEMIMTLDDMDEFEISIKSPDDAKKQALTPLAVGFSNADGATAMQLLSDEPIGSSVDPNKVYFKPIGIPTCIVFKSYEKTNFTPEKITVNHVTKDGS